MPVRTLIIGAGIGGVTAALALRRVGFDVLVCERAPEPREVGAGISLWANALASLDAVGAERAVVPLGEALEFAQIRTAAGRALSRDEGAWHARRLGRPLAVMIHRASLLDALLRLLPVDAVRFGRRCVGVEPGAGAACARFEDGTSEQAEVIIGADGVHSAVRESIVRDGAPRYSGYTCWRGVCPFPESLFPAQTAHEIWGRGARVGLVRIGAGRLYWWATDNRPAGERLPDERAHLQNRFRAWASPVPQVIEATPAGAIIRSDIVDRPPTAPGRWASGRVALLGDAAHPTTPNLGQGGCTAIEDGPELAACLAPLAGGASESRITEALLGFARRRAARTAAITRASWWFGRLGQSESRAMCGLRNAALAATPAFVMRRQVQAMIRHTPPPLPPARPEGVRG